MTITVDQEPLVTDVEPIVVEGRTLVPMRSLFHALGAEIAWNAEEKSVTAYKDNTEIKLYLNQGYAYIDEQIITLDVPATVKNDRVMVPLRFVCEVFGCSVDWDNENNAITITSIYTPEERLAMDVIKLVNKERIKVGLAPLNYDPQLAKAAAIRAEESSILFSHTRPNGERCFTVLKEANIAYHYAGENLAKNFKTPESVVQGWMGSEGHRANILNEKYTKIGVGYYDYCWSQFFIG